MAAFIFQGNPDRFDVDSYLLDAQMAATPIQWMVSQHKHDIRPGDTIYLWRAAGKDNPAIPGVVAKGIVTTPPHRVPPDTRFWRSQELVHPDRPRVDIDLRKVMVGNKEVIRREWMKEDPVLKSLAILSMAQATNYLLRRPEAERLERLVDNTGVDWSPAESMAALWLYNELQDGPISRRSDSPVAEMALRIGRAVTGVYNKLMNFRSIDPRDSRAGLSGINRIDQETWDAYFDSDSKTIRAKSLAEDFERVWGNLTPRVDAEDARTSRAEPPEALNDELRRKRQVSVLVRKGQPAFRKRLLHVYEGKCAISGVDVEAVLDAAHIDGYARSGVNTSTNGVLLRSDLHDLFDAGLLIVDPESLTISIDNSLNGSYYQQFHGKKLRDRTDGKKPDADKIRAKNRTGG